MCVYVSFIIDNQNKSSWNYLKITSETDPDVDGSTDLLYLHEKHSPDK